MFKPDAPDYKPRPSEGLKIYVGEEKFLHGAAPRFDGPEFDLYI